MLSTNLKRIPQAYNTNDEVDPMSKPLRRPAAFPIGILILLALACSSGDADPAGPAAEGTALLRVNPAGGSTYVDASAPLTVEFEHPLMPGMEGYALVHMGDLGGVPVPGQWVWSSDRSRMTFTPSSPLLPGTTYAIHVGGGMMDATGHPVDFHGHGFDMGGQGVTQRMMTGAGMMGFTHPTGSGWQGTGSTYGMVFTFTTGGLSG
jgi:hypothetical protein